MTGASSGIGEATARLCADMGARIVACGRNTARLEQVVAGLTGEGHQAVSGDLTDPAARQSLVDSVVALDGCVFSAGAAALAPIRLVSQRHLDTIFAVNYDAPVLLTQALLARRKLAQGASLVYVTAVAEHVAPNATGIYSGAKAALTATVRTIAVEQAKNGVRANCVSPGYVATPMLDGLQGVMSPNEKAGLAPLGIIEPGDVAASIAWLLAPASRWVSRTSLVIDSGLSLHVR
ncbi:SDR family NAD(P)-dependent oxidoreductase [Massilia sp. H6]|uniref:SDR family NAD(P)-dependent oxidoreductase n=1 Tax=Massilia sp. H6 TaxID=2970464 RepID=UPI0021681AFE|nr:SDR family oxidoreductase [Massilia sp. H6]UVW27865.1 SDR family oxidoreductase [Massilia sp. H6]